MPALAATPDQTASLLKALYQYMVTNAPFHPEISDEIPVLQGAASLFGSENFTAALSTGISVYQALVAARQTNPDLPLP